MDFDLIFSMKKPEKEPDYTREHLNINNFMEEFDSSKYSFEDAATDGTGNTGDYPQEPADMDMSFAEAGDNNMGVGGDDFGVDTSGDDYPTEGGDDGSGMDDEEENDEQKEDKSEIEQLGSTLNPFTQTNQKLYLIDQMNTLYSSVALAIDKFNRFYAKTVEIQQLRDLLQLIDDEQKSIIMGQNPENIIKYRLYLNRFTEIVKNLNDKNKGSQQNNIADQNNNSLL